MLPKNQHVTNLIKKHFFDHNTCNKIDIYINVYVLTSVAQQHIQRLFTILKLSTRSAR